MKPHDELSNPAYWSMRYRERKNGWDQMRPHPFLKHAHAYLGDVSKKKLLVIGAGPGHDAEYFSDVAGKVTALDFSEEAKAHFRAYYPDSKVEYVVGDFFTADLGKFDVVLEHTLLCAIDPKRYGDYFAAVERALNPGGFYAAIVWNKSPVGDAGPPFSVPNATVLSHLKKRGFKIHVECPVEPTVPGREGTETFFYACKN